MQFCSPYSLHISPNFKSNVVKHFLFLSFFKKKCFTSETEIGSSELETQIVRNSSKCISNVSSFHWISVGFMDRSEKSCMFRTKKTFLGMDQNFSFFEVQQRLVHGILVKRHLLHFSKNSSPKKLPVLGRPHCHLPR